MSTGMLRVGVVITCTMRMVAMSTGILRGLCAYLYSEGGCIEYRVQ